jgi:hypothetical protein
MFFRTRIVSSGGVEHRTNRRTHKSCTRAQARQWHSKFTHSLKLSLKSTTWSDQSDTTLQDHHRAGGGAECQGRYVRVGQHQHTIAFWKFCPFVKVRCKLWLNLSIICFYILIVAYWLFIVLDTMTLVGHRNSDILWLSISYQPLCLQVLVLVD